MTTTNGNEESTSLLFSRPADESLESFKRWISGMFEHITGVPLSPEKDMSGAAWREKHAEFWRKMHASEQAAGK